MGELSVSSALQILESLWKIWSQVTHWKTKNKQLNFIAPPIPMWLPVDWAVRFPPINTKRKLARICANQHSAFCIDFFNADIQIPET